MYVVAQRPRTSSYQCYSAHAVLGDVCGYSHIHHRVQLVHGSGCSWYLRYQLLLLDHDIELFQDVYPGTAQRHGPVADVAPVRTYR